MHPSQFALNANNDPYVDELYDEQNLTSLMKSLKEAQQIRQNESANMLMQEVRSLKHNTGDGSDSGRMDG